MIRLLVLGLAALCFTAAPAQAKDCKDFDISGGYITALSVKKTGCGTGTSVAKAFTACRREHGTRGRCTHKVKGFACSDKRMSIQTEFDGNVVCTKRSKRVSFSYQQNT